MKVKELIEVLDQHVTYRVDEVDFENNCKNQKELLELNVIKVFVQHSIEDVLRIEASKYSKKQVQINDLKRCIQQEEQDKALANNRIREYEKKIKELEDDHE